MSEISHFELFVTKIIICYKKYSFCFKFEMETKRVRLAPEHYSSKWNSQVKRHPSCVPSILNMISPLPIRIIRCKHNYLLQENSILIWVELRIRQSRDGTRTSPHGGGTPRSPIHSCFESLRC